VQKVSHLQGFDPQTVQNIDRHYTDYAMPVQLITIIVIIIYIYIYIYTLRLYNICSLIHPLIQTKHLTGLDPAGPAFTNESCDVRFCKGDAVFMEAIHTNGHPLIGFGTSNKDGRIMLFLG
jgi:hypothetical protein